MSKILLKRNGVSGAQPLANEIELGELAINTADGVLYTKKFKDGSYKIVPIGVTELQRVKDSNETRYGWRISTETPENYLEPGLYSITFNQSTESSNKTGASGESAFSIGKNTKATGLGTFAGGIGTIAQNEAMYTIGKYNRGMATDTIVEVGNGDVSSRSNAFEIYTDGRVVAPNLELSMLEGRADGKLLSTKEYVDELAEGNLKSDGSVSMKITYTPVNLQDIATKEYVDNVDGGTF